MRHRHGATHQHCRDRDGPPRERDHPGRRQTLLRQHLRDRRTASQRHDGDRGQFSGASAVLHSSRRLHHRAASALDAHSRVPGARHRTRARGGRGRPAQGGAVAVRRRPADHGFVHGRDDSLARRASHQPDGIPSRHAAVAHHRARVRCRGRRHRPRHRFRAGVSRRHRARRRRGAPEPDVPARRHVAGQPDLHHPLRRRRRRGGRDRPAPARPQGARSRELPAARLDRRDGVRSAGRRLSHHPVEGRATAHSRAHHVDSVRDALAARAQHRGRGGVRHPSGRPAAAANDPGRARLDRGRHAAVVERAARVRQPVERLGAVRAGRVAAHPHRSARRLRHAGGVRPRLQRRDGLLAWDLPD